MNAQLAFNNAYDRFAANDEQIKLARVYRSANIAATLAVPDRVADMLRKRDRVVAELEQIQGFWYEGDLVPHEAINVDRAATLNLELSMVKGELKTMGVTI